jgi:hypothetical protein
VVTGRIRAHPNHVEQFASLTTVVGQAGAIEIVGAIHVLPLCARTVVNARAVVARSPHCKSFLGMKNIFIKKILF